MSEIIRVDSWDPPVVDRLVYMEDNAAVVNFVKIFNKDTSKSLCTFLIGKKSYITQMSDRPNKRYKESDKDGYKTIRGIAHYINYFMRFYDTDNELASIYIRLKVIIDSYRTKLKRKAFIKMATEAFLTESMIKKVYKLVDDNYIDMVPTDKKKKYAEQLAFKDYHVKILFRISIMMKLMLPVVTHYIHMCAKGQLDLVYQFFLPLFTVFNDDVNIYNKLWISVNAKVNASLYLHRRMWGFHDVEGSEPDTKTDELFRSHIISEAMLRYIFLEKPIVLNSVFLDTQLDYFFREDFNNNIIVVDNIKNGEGLSGMDKMEVNSFKIDESIPVLSRLNIDDIIDSLREKVKIKTIDDEIEYYMEKYEITPFQSSLIQAFYADLFGGYRDLDMVSLRQHVTLMTYLKRILQSKNFIYIPQILTAGIPLLKKRVIRNKKFLTKIVESDIYQDLIQSKYPAIIELGRDSYIISILSTMINSEFTILDYDMQDREGEPLEVNLDIVSHEFISFLAMI